MEYWYLLYCKPRQELRAQQQLANQGYATFLPIMQCTKLRSGKWVLLTEPLFPRYLFLSANPGSLNVTAVRSTLGVSDFVRFGQQLAIAPSYLMALLKTQYQQPEVATFSSPVRKGQQITIAAGPFSDIPAVFEMADGEKRSMVLINLVGQWVKASIENNKLDFQTGYQKAQYAF